MKCSVSVPVGIVFLMFAAINAKCLYIFYNPTCPHCEQELGFLYNISPQYNLTIHKFDVLNSNVTPLFLNLSAYYNSSGDVPLTFIGNEAFVGFAYGNASESVNPRLDMGFSSSILRALSSAGNSCPVLMPLSALSCNINSTSCASVVTPSEAKSLANSYNQHALLEALALAIAVAAAIAIALQIKKVRKK
ncbi:MAG: hypothetical protein ACP5T3_03320 [Candidatus Micrarchaeia archaeon]